MESGRLPLKAIISKRQLAFWHTIKEFTQNNPDSFMAHLLQLGKSNNLKYLKHYEKLDEEYNNPYECEQIIHRQQSNDIKTSIYNANTLDPNSKLGTYYQVNPNLVYPSFENFTEYERKLLT